MATQNKNIDTILKNIEKSMGRSKAPVIKKAPTIESFKKIPNIPFGYPEVDKASNCGGIPKGKMVEIYGPESGGKSFLTLKLISEAQKMGDKCVLVDAESSYNPIWAKSNGVDVDDLYIIEQQPDNPLSAEVMLDYVEELCKSGGFGLVVVDSTAALIPQKELDSSVGDQDYALLARAMSKGCRKIVAACAGTKTTCIFINQIRDKMNVMFGCFHYNARVLLEDGSTEKIGKIVNNKLPLSVMSYNQKTGKIEPKKIIAWNNNGNLEEDECFIQIVAEKPFGNGRINVPCTPNHKIFKSTGFNAEEKRYIGVEVEAQDLEVGDELMVPVPLRLNADQMQVAYGSILGDGSLRDATNHSCLLRLGHGLDQKDYLKWKQEIMQNVVSWSDETHFDTKPLFELRELRYSNEPGNNCNNILPSKIVDKLDVLGLTIWYLDDGGFYGRFKKWGKGRSVIYCYKFANKEILMSAFHRMGLSPSITYQGFQFNSEETEKLHSMIAKYVPPCMEYKIHPKFRDKYKYEIDDCIANDPCNYTMVPSKIIDIYEKPSTKTKVKFDLTVEDNSTYFVDSALVHNSPETTPGGKALKFYSSMRIKVTPGSKIKVKEGDVERVIARQSYVQFVKNKVAMPFGECKMEIVFDETARHPLVKLCKAAKEEYKLISIYKNEYRISKDLVKDAKKNIETGATSYPELADYLIKNDMVQVMIDGYFSAVEEDPAVEEDDVDKDLLRLKDDPTSATSPMSGATVEVIQDRAPEISDEEIAEDGDI